MCLWPSSLAVRRGTVTWGAVLCLGACTYQPLRMTSPAGDGDDGTGQLSDQVVPKPDGASSDSAPGPDGGGDGHMGGDPGVAGDGMPSGDAIPTCPLAPTCTVDSGLNVLTETGSMAIPLSAELVPLCSGIVLVGNRADPGIDQVDLTGGGAIRVTLLTSAPGAMALDDLHGRVAVALETGGMVVKPLTGAAEMFLFDGVIDDVAADPVYGFIAIGTPSGAPGRELMRVPPCDTRILPIAPGSFGDLLSVDPVSHTLFDAVTGVSPTTLARHVVDYSAGSVTPGGSRSDVGGNCRDLAVSPTGGHLALACGGGNGSSPFYTVWDFSSADLAVTFGEWNVGTFPRAVAFSRDGSLLVASDRTSLEVYDVATHTLAKGHNFEMATAGCDGGEIRRVGISRGNGLAIGLADCDAGTSSRLFWLKL